MILSNRTFIALLLLLAWFPVVVRCALTGVVTVAGSGSSLQSRFLYQAMDTLMRQAKAPIRLTYRSVGSGGGRTEFGLTSATYGPDYSTATFPSNFAASDVPLAAADYGWLTNNSIAVMQIPTVLAAIAVFHTVPNQANPIRLTSCVLADIFQRKTKTWDDPTIIALNPTLNVPPGQPITTWHRSDASGSTQVYTQFLQTCSNAGQSWAIGSGQGGPGSVIPNWDPGTLQASGSDGIVRVLLNTPFSIAYVDAGAGVAAALAEVQVLNANGSYVTSQSADYSVVTNSVATPLTTADWSGVSLINRPEYNVYPISTFSYMILHLNMTDMGEKGALTKGLAKFLISNEGQALAVSFGFAPLPTALTGGYGTGTGCLTDSASLTLLNMTAAQVVSPSNGLPYMCTQLGGIGLASGVSDWLFEDAGARLGSINTANNDKAFSANRVNALDYSNTQSGQVAAANQAALASLALATTGADRTVTLQAHGSGSTLLSGLIWKVTDLLSTRAKAGIRLTYRATGSAVGVGELVGVCCSGANLLTTPYTNFAGSDVPLSTAFFTVATGNGVAVFQVPVALSTITVFHTLPMPATGSPPTVNFTADILSGIFQGKITLWSDAAIAAANPYLSQWAIPAGKAIQPFVRSDGSGTTQVFTSWLVATASVTPFALGSGTGGKDLLTGAAVAPLWPATFTTAIGSRGLATTMAASSYGLAFMDPGTADFAPALTEAALMNAAGVYLTTEMANATLSTAAQVAGGVSVQWPGSPLSNWDPLTVKLFNQPGLTAFPIVAYEYIILAQDMTQMRESGSLALAMVKYMLSAEGQALLPGFSLSPIPTVVAQRSLASFNRAFFANGVTAWAFEPLPTPALGAGAGNKIFSSFRDSYNDYQAQLAAVTTSTSLAGLQTQLAALAAGGLTCSAGSSTGSTGSTTAVATGGNGTATAPTTAPTASAPTAASGSLTFSAAFATLTMSQLADPTFNATFIGNYKSAVGTAAGLTAAAVTITGTSSGSTILATAVTGASSSLTQLQTALASPGTVFASLTATAGAATVTNIMLAATPSSSPSSSPSTSSGGSCSCSGMSFLVAPDVLAIAAICVAGVSFLLACVMAFLLYRMRQAAGAQRAAVKNGRMDPSDLVYGVGGKGMPGRDRKASVGTIFSA